MAEKGRTAYITGGASGIGKAVAQMLVERGAKVFLADRDVAGAESVAASLNQHGKVAAFAQVEADDWDLQVKAFEAAIAEFGRIDYVFPIAGISERRWITKAPGETGFSKPDLSVLDVDLKGMAYTVALAVQQFRRQDLSNDGFRGKICCVASVCGLYTVATVPIYTAAKHGVVGLVRSYGKYLPEEGITMNAVCPSVIRTNISPSWFYDEVEKRGVMTYMDGVLEAFSAMLGPSVISGVTFEAGPRGGYAQREGVDYLDEPSKTVCDMLYDRALPLQKPE